MDSEEPRRRTTPAARESLTRRFGLHFDPFSQDWEWEVSHPARFAEFLNAYSSGDLGEDERFALMEILIQCIEDMELSSVKSSPQWVAVESLLLANPGLHASSIRYWSCLDLDIADSEYWFRVTDAMRTVWSVIGRDEA